MGNQEISSDKTIKLNDGRAIGFAEYGVPNGGPIFYFHGLCGSRLEMSRFHDIAVTEGYRLIALDRPGMGLSSMDKKRSILSWVKDVESVADHLGIEKFSVIGHSGGAAYVAACAYVIPQRIQRAAIVSGMAPLDDPEANIGMVRGRRVVNSLIKTMPWLSPMMMRLTLLMLKNPDKMMAQMIKQLPEVDQVLFRDPDSCKAIMNSTIEAFRNGIAGPADDMKLLFKPWGFNLERIVCPITVWHGTLDTQGPISHAKIYARLIPNAELNIIENEGHHSLIKNRIKEILRAL